MVSCCEKCGNADNFEWEEIQKDKPWLIKCLDCGHSWTESKQPPNHNMNNRVCGDCIYFRYRENNPPSYWDCGLYDWPTHHNWVCDSWKGAE